MFIRPRGSSLSLERSTYTAASTNPDGSILPAKRGTLHLGSLRVYQTYSTVDRELLARLTDAEKDQLREHLKGNEPQADRRLASVPRCLQLAADELITLADAGNSTEAKAALKAHIKAAEAAWESFFKAAQSKGLRRALKRTKKQAAAATPG